MCCISMVSASHNLTDCKISRLLINNELIYDPQKVIRRSQVVRKLTWMWWSKSKMQNSMDFYEIFITCSGPQSKPTHQKSNFGGKVISPLFLHGLAKFFDTQMHTPIFQQISKFQWRMLWRFWRITIWPALVESRLWYAKLTISPLIMHRSMPKYTH